MGFWNYDFTMEVQEGYFSPEYDTQPSDEENGVLMQAIKYAYTVYLRSILAHLFQFSSTGGLRILASPLLFV